MTKNYYKNGAEDRAIRMVDKLAKFEDFETNILPALQADIKKGVGAEDLAKKYSSLAMARLITIMATSQDSSALAAVKDILDRSLGKPQQSVEISTKLNQLSDDELDALIDAKVEGNKI